MASITEVVDWETTPQANSAHHPAGPTGREATRVSLSFREMQAAIARWRDTLGGGSDIIVQDEGTPLTTAVTKFNFAGAGVTVTEPVADEVLVTIPGGSTSAGGSNTELQYNDGGGFDGIAGATYNNGTGVITFNLGSNADIVFQDAFTVGNAAIRFGDSSTYIHGVSTDTIRLGTGNTDRVTITTSLITLALPLSVPATDRIYFDGGGNTHIHESSADVLDITVGNRLVVQLDDTSTAGDTNMLLYDVDSAATVRVSVGADDSGGSGFKVLRIPN